MWSGIIVAFGVTGVSTVAGSLLAIDDDERGTATSCAAGASRRAITDGRPPGVLFLEIDGLAHEVLLRAFRDGNAPTMARWVRDGSHRLMRWETDWSSQTGACQAGLLHGNNEDIPAFRWWEKEHGRAIVTNHPRDAAEIERRDSDGHGLLHDDGASRANILSGDAPHSLLTMSTVLELTGRGRLGEDYAAYFSSPYNMTRTRAGRDRAHRPRAVCATAQRRRDVQPRIKRTLRLRAGARRGRPRSSATCRCRPSWPTARRPARRLHDVPGLRRGRPPLGDRAARHDGRPARRRPPGRAASPTRPPPRRAATSSSCCPTTARRRARRSATATATRWRSSCATPVRPRTSTRSGSGEDEALGRLGAALTEGDRRRRHGAAAPSAPRASAAWTARSASAPRSPRRRAGRSARSRRRSS